MSLIYRLGYIITALCLTLSCTQVPIKDADHTDKKYSIYIMDKDGNDYLLESNSLKSGRLIPEHEGISLNQYNISRSVIVKNGYYFHADRKKELFTKYKSNGRSLAEIGSVPLDDFSVENKYWVDADTLLLTGLDSKNFSQVKYALINTGSMTLISSGKMDIPLPSGVFDNISICFAERRKQQLFVGYTYHQQLGPSDYTTSDTTYVTELNYPEMTAIKTAKDTRATYPGGINTIQSSSFNDELGNFYFMACPGIAMGNRPELPTAVMRIKVGEDTPDNGYFLNLSASQTRNHAYGMWYLGNGQAIIRSERKDLFTGLGDHYSVPHFEFYLLDIATGKILKKLELPLDKGTRRECVLVQDGIAYISVNSSKEGNFVWLYDILSGTLKKGLQLSGGTDYIMRIDRLNP